ncbi:MAG: glycosyltransferase family 4 protein [Luteibaculaceae bacterium]
MAILQLCLSSSLGGLELYCLKTAKFFNEKTSTKVYALVKNGSILNQKIVGSGVSCILWEKQTGKFPLFSALKIVQKIKKLDIGIIHVHCKKDLPLAVLIKVVLGNSIKVVHTRQMNMPHKKKNFYHNFLYQNVDILIAITKKLQHDILKNTTINPQKVRQLYYGVAKPSDSWMLDFKKLITKYEFKPAQDKFRIAVFGNLNPKKAQDTFIDAIHLVKKQMGVPIAAYCIGKFIDKDFEVKILAKIDEYQLNKELIVTGFIDNAANLMPGFDAVVLTTKGETFGLVLAEAMHAGCAVIGTNSEGVPEIIQHRNTGLLYEPGNAQELAESILYYMSNADERKKIAVKGKEFAAQWFDEENHFTELQNIFERLN